MLLRKSQSRLEEVKDERSREGYSKKKSGHQIEPFSNWREEMIWRVVPQGANVKFQFIFFIEEELHCLFLLIYSAYNFPLHLIIAVLGQAHFRG